jgi:selenocysteine lyase/cysteine desulfurase
MPENERPERNPQELRKQFPILGNGLYFNHAAVGPWPRCTTRAVQEFADENMRCGSTNYPAWIRREAKLRSKLARLTGAASEDDIALLKNTTEGICAVAWGLNWRAGDNIVLPANEFASNRLPWLAQAVHGVEIREVDIRSAHDPESELIDAMDRHTRLLSASAVQWDDGLRLDLPVLGKACRDRSALFFVDAIQQLGALPMDVEACRIDFLAADAHKWLLGPEGIAVFYCREDVREQLALTQQGWHMFEDPWNFHRQDWTPAASAKRFEAGSPNTIGQTALNASTGLLLDYGMQGVASRLLSNTDALIQSLTTMPGIRICSRTEPRRRSGIVSFSHETIPVRNIHRALERSGVSCAVRGTSIRLSPHFYQGEPEITAFNETLQTILDS